MKYIAILIIFMLLCVGAEAKYSPALDLNGVGKISSMLNGTALQDAVTVSQLTAKKSIGEVTVGFWGNCTYRLDPADADHSDDLNAAFGDASRNGKSVRMMIGKYKIHSARVLIPAGLSVSGSAWPFPAAHTNFFDNSTLGYSKYTVFDVDYTGSNAIGIEGGASLERVAFNYPAQNGYHATSWTAYPAAIKILSNYDASDPGSIKGGGVHLEKIFLRNPYVAINATPLHTANVYTDIYGGPISRGVYVGDYSGAVLSGSSEPDHYTRVHWNPVFQGDGITSSVAREYNYIRDNMIGFDIHHSDGLQMTNCYVYNAAYGYKFHKVEAGAMITACGADSCKVNAFWLTSCYGMNIVGCQASTGNNSLTSDASSISVLMDGVNGRCSFNSGTISSQGKAVYIDTTGADVLGQECWGNVISGNNIRYNAAASTSQKYAITVNDGTATTISNNVLNGLAGTYSAGIAVQRAATDTMVTGNTLLAMGSDSLYMDGTTYQCYGNIGQDVGAVSIGGAGTHAVNGDNVDV